MAKTLVEQFVESQEGMRSFQQERAIHEVTELIEERMEDKGVSRSELATLLNKSKGWVTQLLDDEANKTIRTIADVFAVLGREVHFSDNDIEVASSKPQIFQPLETLDWEVREVWRASIVLEAPKVKVGNA